MYRAMLILWINFNLGHFFMNRPLTIPEQGSSVFSKGFKHYLMCAAFLMLPQKVTKVYLVLALAAFIYHVRSKKFEYWNVNVGELQSLLNVSMNNEVLLLPSRTYHWIWNDSILDEKIKYLDEELSVRDILTDKQLMVHHLQGLSQKFLEKVPKALLYKLKMKEEQSRVLMRHDFARTIAYNF